MCSALFCCAGVAGQTAVPLNRPVEWSDTTSLLMTLAGRLAGPDLLTTVRILSDDTMQGRAAGSDGYNRAAVWVAGRFRRNGLFPLLADSTFFQHFPMDNKELRSRVHGPVPDTDSSATMNVIGYVPGADDSLRQRFVVVTAHLDHIGAEGDTVFHGANDNASGVAVLIGVADALASTSAVFRRSVVFMAFSGEEVGLKGSEFFVRHPWIPLDRIDLLINLDLVGSGSQGFMLQGSERWPAHEKQISDINKKHFGFEMSTRVNSPNSDHYHFNAAGVPAFFVYAYQGTSPYHSPGDTADRLDPMVLENIAKLVLLIVGHFADSY